MKNVDVSKFEVTSGVEGFEEYLKGCKSFRELYNKVSSISEEEININVRLRWASRLEKETLVFMTGVHPIYSDQTTASGVCNWGSDGGLSLDTEFLIEDQQFVDDLRQWVATTRNYGSLLWQIKDIRKAFLVNNPAAVTILNKLAEMKDEYNNTATILNQQLDELVKNAIDAARNTLGLVACKELGVSLKSNLEDSYGLTITGDGVIKFKE